MTDMFLMPLSMKSIKDSVLARNHAMGKIPKLEMTLMAECSMFVGILCPARTAVLDCVFLPSCQK